ncbi:nitrate- and nitrite sensing domain-containing protein [Streptomyces sp. NPDC051219]|uniref:nitrate- and nitrite sensing domain-containing protein n=1 Tax=Streptomyces sp. NPDC051219 TaxID=3155283 RepID=UPI00342D3E94
MQGRFKRDGSAAAEQEPRGGTDRGSSPQHAQNQGPATVKDGSGGPRPGAKGGEPPAAPKAKARAKSPSGPGSRIALQNWRISTRLVSLLALPVVAATSLGGLRINESMNDIDQLEHMQLLTNMTKQATALAAALQEERDKTAGPLSAAPEAPNGTVDGVREKTDKAVQAFSGATAEVKNTENDETLESIRGNVVQIARQLSTLEEIRKDAYKSTSQPTISKYSQLITSLLSLSQDMAQATSNPEMIQRTRALAAFSSAKEYASIQRAVIAAALPRSGITKLNENDRLYGLDNFQNEDKARQIFEVAYQGKAEELTAPLTDGNTEIAGADKYAKRVLSNPGQIEKETSYTSWLDWYDADDNKIQAMKTIELTLLEDMEQKARELRNESEREAFINGALILLVLGVSLVGAFVVARSMIRSLRRLQDTATSVAQERLPELVKQLSESDPQDVDTSVESVGVHSRDEIGQVAAAFDDVHREAVRLAAEQALLRGNVNAMFTNLSRRSQGLIQRQLSLISELESREADPDQLSSLFKLDHLATRMRRNGENLLVLAGEEPGRRWTRPVPLVDVLRAAASEVEQYERIELAAVPATEVAGRVVNDLVHLLAELLENATSFSSPQTKVKVTGHALPDGRVLIEIHDTGIGLSPEDLAAINERLASPPTVDVSVSRRMGLFVVGRLSLRHGIRIQLRPSDSGGTTALVMLPVDVAQGGKKAPAKPGAPGGQPPQGAGMAAPPAAGGRLAGNAGAQRGQVPGSGSRAALPGRDGAPRQNQSAGQGAGQGGNAFGAGGPMGGRGNAGSSGTAQGRPGAGHQGQAQNPGQGQNQGQGAFQQLGFERPKPGGRAAAGGDQPQKGQPQLPPRSTPRAELPGGNPQQAQRPATTSWGNDQTPDTPRGHDDRQGPGATAEFARPDYNAAPPQGNSATGQFERPDVRGPVNPAPTGQYPRPDAGGLQDPASTAQFERPGFPAQRPVNPTGAYGQQNGQQGGRQNGQQSGRQGTPNNLRPAGGHTPPAAPRQPAGRLPQAHQPEALPPAGPGDGRTPLFDTLESNWFRGTEGEQPGAPQAPAVSQQPQQPPAHQPAPVQRRPERGADNASGAAWRTSPNDELVRQAERVRQPAAGGVTTSGLPRRVPRANLVAGTAQQQSGQTGPQVSRAPDDVRGRLTNLRRGIQQGRQAGSGPSTGSHHFGPTHQQER